MALGSSGVDSGLLAIVRAGLEVGFSHTHRIQCRSAPVAVHGLHPRLGRAAHAQEHGVPAPATCPRRRAAPGHALHTVLAFLAT